MRRGVLTFMAVLGVAAALTVTASSTVTQAHTAGLGDLPAAALVVLLEVINTVGAWSWITDARTRVRVESAIGVCAASAVTGTFGALTYGPTGIVAALGLLAAVHLVSRMWTSPVHTAAPTAGTAPRPLGAVPVCLTPPPARPVAPSGDDDDDDPETTDEAITEWVAAHQAAHGRAPGRDLVKRQWSVGTKRAERVLAEHAARPRLSAVPAQEAAR